MPRPNEGESEQDYVSRFMGDAESLRDYPDEKQRAAVAYSMFKEKGNAADKEVIIEWPQKGSGKFWLVRVKPTDGSFFPLRETTREEWEAGGAHDSSEKFNSVTDLCASCGAATSVNPGELVNSCGGCGHRTLGKLLENADLGARCPSCAHPKAAHDALGCRHDEVCNCARPSTSAGPLVAAAERYNAFAAHAETCAACGPAYRAVHGAQELCNAGAALLDPGARANADDAAAEATREKSDYGDDGGCKRCGWGAPGTGHTSGYHKDDCKTLQKERDRYEHFQGQERRNAEPRAFKFKGVKDPKWTHDFKDFEVQAADEETAYRQGAHQANLPLEDFKQRWSLENADEPDMCQCGHHSSAHVDTDGPCKLCDTCEQFWRGAKPDAAPTPKYNAGQPLCANPTCGHVEGQHDGLRGKCFDEARPEDAQAQHPSEHDAGTGFKRCSCQKFARAGEAANAGPKLHVWQEPNTSDNHPGGEPPPYEVRDENDETVAAYKTEAEAQKHVERGNAHPLDDKAKQSVVAMWQAASTDERGRTLQAAGLDASLATRSWQDLPADAAAAFMAEFFGLENASRADFQKWKAGFDALQAKMRPLTDRMRALQDAHDLPPLARGQAPQAGAPSEYVELMKQIDALEVEQEEMLRTRPVEMDNATCSATAPCDFSFDGKPRDTCVKCGLNEADSKAIGHYPGTAGNQRGGYDANGQPKTNSDDNAMIEAARGLILGGAMPAALPDLMRQKFPDLADDRIAAITSAAWRRLTIDPATLGNAAEDDAFFKKYLEDGIRNLEAWLAAHQGPDDAAQRATYEEDLASYKSQHQALGNADGPATEPVSVGGDAGPRRDIGGKDLDGQPRTAAQGETTYKIPKPPENANSIERFGTSMVYTFDDPREALKFCEELKAQGHPFEIRDAVDGRKPVTVVVETGDQTVKLPTGGAENANSSGPLPCPYCDRRDLAEVQTAADLVAHVKKNHPGSGGADLEQIARNVEQEHRCQENANADAPCPSCEAWKEQGGAGVCGACAEKIIAASPELTALRAQGKTVLDALSGRRPEAANGLHVPAGATMGQRALAGAARYGKRA